MAMNFTGIEPYRDDLFTEPDGDPDTLSRLGPLTALAGVWEGTRGDDEHPSADGSREPQPHLACLPVVPP